MESAEWYYVNAEGTSVGPLQQRDMDALFRAGEISMSTPTWTDGEEAWMPLGHFPVFAESFADDEITLALNSQPTVEQTEQKPPEKDRVQKVAKRKRQKEKKRAKWYCPKVNTNVYISGLPATITEARVAEFFSKAGIIRLDKFTGEPKVKLYKDESGQPKGDALVSYAKEESVLLAITWLNNQEIEPGAVVAVQPAEFEQKGNYRPREIVKIDKVQLLKTKQKQSLQLDWDEEESRGLHIVVLKNVFTPQDHSPQFFEQLKADILQECEEKLGKVTRLRLFEHHPEGVIDLRFEKASAALKCVEMMNGRFYAGRSLQCAFWDGKTDYKHVRESDEQEAKRIEEFGKWLEHSSSSEEEEDV